MKKRLLSILLVAFLALCAVPVSAGAAGVSRTSGGGSMNMYQNSDFIEKEQPELSEETKQRISLYQKNPTEENYLNLRAVVIEDYNAVLERKEAKLAEFVRNPKKRPRNLFRPLSPIRL